MFQTIAKTLTVLATISIAVVGCSAEKKCKPDIQAGGAFTCDFSLPAAFPPEQIGPAIERDRMYMSERPGMLHKHIPINVDTGTGNFLTGGRYLFDTAEHASAYRDWVTTSFDLDGTLFLTRPFFISPECHSWEVIGARDLKDIHSAQTVLRTERWQVPATDQKKLLRKRFDDLVTEAESRGLSSVWLLYNEGEALVSLVYFGGRAGPSDPMNPDGASLGALAGAAALGDLFNDQPWTKSFDRSQWTLTIWFPFALGDRGEPALWPNTPPFPQPFPGDGVCEVSRGESAASTADCLATCGDGVVQVGENSTNCPGDVRLLFP